MKELWAVKFHGDMIDPINHPTPAIDGELIVHANGVHNAVHVAESLIEKLEFDNLQILGVRFLTSEEK